MALAGKGLKMNASEIEKVAGLLELRARMDQQSADSGVVKTDQRGNIFLSEAEFFYGLARRLREALKN